MLGTKDRVISGKTYKIVQLAASPGRAMLIRLLKLMGPSVAEVLRTASPGSDGSFSFSSITGSGLADAITELCTRISESDFEEICQVFLDKTEVLNPETGGFMAIPPHFAFAGDYGSLFKLLAFHVEFNYSSFFDGLGITKPRT